MKLSDPQPRLFDISKQVAAVLPLDRRQLDRALKSQMINAYCRIGLTKSARKIVALLADPPISPISIKHLLLHLDNLHGAVDVDDELLVDARVKETVDE